MIDYFAIGLTHGLLALAAWRLLLRDDLDTGDETGARKKPKLWLKQAKAPDADSGDA